MKFLDFIKDGINSDVVIIFICFALMALSLIFLVLGLMKPML